MSDAFSDPNTMGELRAEIARLRSAISETNADICQTLGRALGYPKFCDDQQTFPGATESSGVCAGDHVAESIAVEAAKRIESLRAAVATARREGWIAGRDAARNICDFPSGLRYRSGNQSLSIAIAALAPPPENADD